METRELARRQTHFENVPIVDYLATPAFFSIRQLSSPANDRSSAIGWRLDEIIAGLQTPAKGTAYNKAVAIIFATGQGIRETDSLIDSSVATNVTDPLTLLFQKVPECDIVAVTPSLVGVAELDFHPVIVNNTEQLGIAFYVNFTTSSVPIGSSPPQNQFGWSISYTIISNR